MIKKFMLMSAPLEAISNCEYRKKCFEAGADLTFCEMARVSNLCRKKRGEIEKTKICYSVPTQIQLAGSKLLEYKKYLDGFEVVDGFCGFNLNLGCPSPQFIRQGLGCAMMKRVSKVQEIVRMIEEYGFECSIKMRLGLNKYEKEKHIYLNLIENVDASFFVVHAKTADQTENDPADFSVYSKCVNTDKKIVANGDIRTKEQIDKLKSEGLYGAMIGRAAIRDPMIFEELNYKVIKL